MITQFADCEIDTHVTTKALLMELVKGDVDIRAVQQSQLLGSPATTGPETGNAGPKPAVNLSQGKAKFRRLPGLPKTFFYVIY